MNAASAAQHKCSNSYSMEVQMTTSHSFKEASTMYVGTCYITSIKSGLLVTRSMASKLLITRCFVAMHMQDVTSKGTCACPSSDWGWCW